MVMVGSLSFPIMTVAGVGVVAHDKRDGQREPNMSGVTVLTEIDIWRKLCSFSTPTNEERDYDNEILL